MDIVDEIEELKTLDAVVAFLTRLRVDGWTNFYFYHCHYEGCTAMVWREMTDDEVVEDARQRDAGELAG